MTNETQQKQMTLEFVEGSEKSEVILIEKHPLCRQRIFMQGTIITETPFGQQARSLQRNRPGKSTWQIGHEYPDLNLTARQQQIVFYLIHGKSNKEIAWSLSISARSVDEHIIQIREKLNCSSKSQIVEKAFAEGLAYFIPHSILKR